MSAPNLALIHNADLSAAAFLTSSATLVCCVLPAALLALGAGRALAGLVTAVPQLIWLSEHKPLVFGVAGKLLIASGAAIWYGRSLRSHGSGRGARLYKTETLQRDSLRSRGGQFRSLCGVGLRFADS